MTEIASLPSNFVQGRVKYSDRYPGENYARIVVGVTLGDSDHLVHAIVDTGAPWCIFGPKWVEAVGIDYQQDQDFQEAPLIIRGSKCKGWLCRMPVSLKTNRGESLTIEATVFVPKLDGQEWLLPNFLGLTGFLERIRFAIDPEHNFFYFGSDSF